MLNKRFYINRLRIGHTLHILPTRTCERMKILPMCKPCNSLLTVEHIILINCVDFDVIRQNFYTASNLKDVFHNIHPK